LADTQTAKVRPILAPIKKAPKEVVNLASRRNTLTTATNLLPLYDVHTHTPVMCVKRHCE
jgi:hypothetical protein